MLPTHGRYKFSAITQRPDYRWPGDKRLAVYIALNVEQFSFGQGKGSQIAPSDQAASQSVYSWRDYGNRVGFWRLLELFDTLGLPIQAQMNSAIYDHCPEIADALRRRGDLRAELPALKAVGYRQVWRYLEGDWDYPTMVEKGIIATRQLAKRQLTWLRKWPGVETYDNTRDEGRIACKERLAGVCKTVFS